MTAKRINTLAVLLVLAGLLVVGAASYRHMSTVSGGQSQAAPEFRLTQTADVDINLESLISSETFVFEKAPPDLDGGDILAIFVLNTKVCAPCLNEVAGYADLIGEFADMSAEIRSLALVLAEGDGARHFARSAMLPMPTGYGFSKEMADLLGDFAGIEEKILQQLVFVDVHKKKLFFRVLLPKISTSQEHKSATLESMRVAWSSDDH